MTTTDGLDAAIEAATLTHLAITGLQPDHNLVTAFVRAAYPHIRRAVLNEAADDAATSDWAWLRVDAQHWLRERAEEGGDG